VELTGFEPVTSSLRKMRSKPRDQEKRYEIAVLWSGCGASLVRHGEISAVFTKSVASHDVGCCRCSLPQSEARIPQVWMGTNVDPSA
jgi:hypothetical protein